MPLCGFDEQMLDGLGMFYNGLLDAVVRKSKKKDISIEEAIVLELKDIDGFLKELVILNNEIDKQKLIGITNYAKSFYLGSLNLAKTKGIDILEAMKKEIEKTRDFLFEIDKYFYSYLENKEDSMKKLVHWINEGGRNAPKRI
jgi:hypothetical protein